MPIIQPAILPTAWAGKHGRTRAIGTVLWFMRGIPPRSALSYVVAYRDMTGPRTTHRPALDALDPIRKLIEE